MPLPTFSKGTRPAMSIPPAVTINAAGWTQLWGADPTRSFAAVLGGTGVTGEDIYVTANPLALVTDLDVATFAGIRGALYFETRGTNALYARKSGGSPLAVRTTVATQVNKSPYPTGLIGTKSYHIESVCGHKTLTYFQPSGGGPNARFAPIFSYDADRLRTTFTSALDAIIYISAWGLPIIGRDSEGLQLGFMSSGPAFPGPLILVGPNALMVDQNNVATFPVDLHWVMDRRVSP